LAWKNIFCLIDMKLILKNEFTKKGDMNNITFGNENGGYYETVGGGAGKLILRVKFKNNLEFKTKTYIPKALVRTGTEDTAFIHT
jgi:hypothetical protein